MLAEHTGLQLGAGAVCEQANAWSQCTTPVDIDEREPANFLLDKS